MGNPQEFARKYYEDGADELIYMDIVASLYGRSNLIEIVRRTAHDVFVPMTVGGGIRSVEDAGKLLRAGADKIAINTAAVKRPELVSEVARKFGSQCMVLSIEAKRRGVGNWEVYTDCGREATGIDAVSWAVKAVEHGAGEILITSIDQEGTRKGFDTALAEAISERVNVPIICSGGYGQPDHLRELSKTSVDGVAFADVLHYRRATLGELRSVSKSIGYHVRLV